jgi:hypothetical protein
MSTTVLLNKLNIYLNYCFLKEKLIKNIITKMLSVQPKKLALCTLETELIN